MKYADLSSSSASRSYNGQVQDEGSYCLHDGRCLGWHGCLNSLPKEDCLPEQGGTNVSPPKGLYS